MKTCNALTIVVLFFGPYCFGQATADRPTNEAPKVNPGYSISVSSPSELFRLGSPINIAITVTAGDKEIYWRAEKSATAYRAFHFLLSKDGREGETTTFHRRITGRERPDDPPGDFGAALLCLPLRPENRLHPQ
jgi:hypothetical protein